MAAQVQRHAKEDAEKLLNPLTQFETNLDKKIAACYKWKRVDGPQRTTRQKGTASTTLLGQSLNSIGGPWYPVQEIADHELQHRGYSAFDLNSREPRVQTGGGADGASTSQPQPAQPALPPQVPAAPDLSQMPIDQLNKEVGPARLAAQEKLAALHECLKQAKELRREHERLTAYVQNLEQEWHSRNQAPAPEPSV